MLLTKNVWQIAGLCNGATGIVKEIIYDDNNPAPGLCSCVIVDFGDTYVGEPFFDDDDSKKGWVPIFPTTAEWETVEGDSRKTHARTMIPLRLSYAWTIWKSQGQTIRNKVVVHLGDKEKEHGLTYTAFSRVTRSSDIGIDDGFPCDRLIEKVQKQHLMSSRINEERFLIRRAITRTRQKLRSMDPIPFCDIL